MSNKRFKDNEVEGVVLWFINDVCNYHCSYCFANRFSGAKVENYREHLESIKRNIPGNWRFNITGGGEPFAHPDFFKIIKGLMISGRRIGITSNLSLPANDLVKFLHITKYKLDFFIASLHLEFTRVESFLEKIIKIKEKTPFFKNFLVASVALPDKLEKLVLLSKIFHKHGIKFLFQRLQINNKFYRYSVKQNNIILDNKSLVHKNITPRKRSVVINEEKKCASGRKSILLLPDGSIFRCVPMAHQKIGNLGNIFQKSRLF